MNNVTNSFFNDSRIEVFMKKILTFATFILPILFCSCSPEIKVKMSRDNSVELSFQTGFSDNVSKTIKKITGMKESDPIISPNDMATFLTEAGATKVKANLPNKNEVKAEGTLQKIESSAFYATGFLKKDEKSLSLSLGPNEIKKLYDLLDENTKSYFDLIMIPALIGEEMSIAEYKMLLAGMYGKNFANEITDGTVVISVESPNGKTTKITENLGNLLTLTQDKTWKVEL